MSSILPTYLTYYDQYGLIICSTHQSALHETKILDHMTKSHYDKPLNSSYLDSLRLVSLETAHHMIVSSQPIHPILGLKDPQLGFQCKLCGLVRLSQRRIRDHLYQDHQIQGYQAQDQQATSCLVQALVGSAYLFTTTLEPLSLPNRPTQKRPRELSIASASQGPITQRTRVDNSLPQVSDPSQFLASFTTLRQTLRGSTVINLTGETYEARGFFTDSQYPIFLNGRDTKDLEVLFTLENPDHITWLSAIVYRLLHQGSSLIGRTNTQTLGVLNSFSQDPIYQATLRPLRPLQNQLSMQRYCLVFQAFISFLLRSYCLLDHSSGGPTSYLGLYSLSPSQSTALGALETFLSSLPTPDTTYHPGPRASSLVSDSSESASDTDSDDKALPSLPETTLNNPRVDRGVGLLMQLVLALAECQITHQQEIPLFAFLACYSRNYIRDCFKPLEQISHAYSAMIKGHQFVFLYWLHTVKFATPTQDESMASVVRHWMNQYFTAQSESPLGHVLVLRGLAFTIMKSSTALGRIHLIGPNTLRYGHITLSQQDLKVLVTKGLGQLALDLSNELFLGFTNFQEVSYKYIYRMTF